MECASTKEFVYIDMQLYAQGPTDGAKSSQTNTFVSLVSGDEFSGGGSVDSKQTASKCVSLMSRVQVILRHCYTPDYTCNTN